MLPIEHPEIVELTKAAKQLNEAIRHDAVGMGSATARSMRAVQHSEDVFKGKLATTNWRRIAELLLQLDDSIIMPKS